MKNLLFPLAIGFVGTLILLWLGTWQVQRLNWKESVLSDIEARITAAPVAIPNAPDQDTARFLPVRAEGVISSDFVRVLASQKVQGAGYRIISVFETEGRRVLIDRGFSALTANIETPGGDVSIIGNLHWPVEADSFTPEPDFSANIWFARDVDKLSAHFQTEPILVVARSVSPADAQVTPLPVDTNNIPNDHLEYAITWYSLAAVWVGMTIYWIRRRRQSKGTKEGKMRYISTRGQAPELSFEEAMLTGLARDGGLYVPGHIPVMAREDIAALAGLSYEEIAFRVMKPFIGDTFTDEEFKELIASAYSGFGHAARAPLKQIAPNEFLLELFHGPTLAFKDFAMQLIGQMFQSVLAKRGSRVTIVGATSGDTGSAAIEAFQRLENVDVFILFPHGRVSEVQRRQMTTPAASNVHALAIDGDFDDCQARLKDMFNDLDFRDEVQLAGVNSINWARVLAQVVYYFSSAVSLGAPEQTVNFVVPTGNFGDVFAGYIAKRMGLPIGRLVIATNQNDILHRTVANNDHTKSGVSPSVSPSMDIQVSSNFERLLFDLYDRDGSAVRQLMDELNTAGGFSLSQGPLEQLREEFDSAACDEPTTMATMKSTLETSGEIVCPHTATGVFASGKALVRDDTPTVILATAHPAKFPDAVEKATGKRPGLPNRMADLYDRAERVQRVSNDLAALQNHIRENRRS